MKLISNEKINTNNAWGFGGWMGTRKEYDNGLIIDEGKFCYRHSKEEHFWRTYIRFEERKIQVFGHKQGAKFVLIYKCITPNNEWRYTAQYDREEVKETTSTDYYKNKLTFELISSVKI